MKNNFGSLIIDLQGLELSPEEAELLDHPLVGGLILFTRNYDHPEQLKSLIQTLRKKRSKPFLIMVDQEGGRVQRFRPGFTLLPPAANYGEAYDQDSALGLRLAEAGGWVMAYELLSYGIDLSLAPILDLNKGISSVIGNRAFHRDSSIAIKLAAAYIQGMKTAGMAATGKHFPGHGSVAPDSHHELPVDPRSLTDLEKEDLQPFIHFINQHIPALMTAHILFPAIDDEPVSFSRYWLQDILRKKLKFQGVIMSDDLEMKGAAKVGNYADRMRLAREAGCDLILLCNNRNAVIQVLDQVDAASHQLDNRVYELLRGRFPDLKKSPQENETWIQHRDFLLNERERGYASHESV